MKNVFPMLTAALLLGAAAAEAEPFNCNDFPDFHARMSCYDAVSRGPLPRDTAQQTQSPDASSKAASTHKVKKNKKRQG